MLFVPSQPALEVSTGLEHQKNVASHTWEAAVQKCNIPLHSLAITKRRHGAAHEAAEAAEASRIPADFCEGVRAARAGSSGG